MRGVARGGSGGRLEGKKNRGTWGGKAGNGKDGEGEKQGR